MARTDNLSNYLKDVISVVKVKKGDNSPINASELDTEISNIQTGTPSIGTIEITSNGVYDVKYKAQANVSVPIDVDDYFDDYFGGDIEGDSMYPAAGYWYLSVTRHPPFIIPPARKNLNNFFFFSRLKEINVSKPNGEPIKVIRGAFMQSSQAETIIANLDVGEVTGKYSSGQYYAMDTVFFNCQSLKNLTFFTNYGKGFGETKINNKIVLSFKQSRNLTHDSAMDVINKLYDLNLTYDVANGGVLYTQQLIFNRNCQQLLSEQEIAIATNKGWTVLFQT